MRTQPDLAVVSRERGGDYASAAREGTPQAIQCADRFHIVKNLTEAVQVLLARCAALHPERLQKYTAKTAIWLFVRDPKLLNEIEREDLATFCQASAPLKKAYDLLLRLG
jgi:transposase